MKQELLKLKTEYGGNLYKTDEFKEIEPLIVDATNFFDYDVKMKYRVMCVLSDIKEYPKCPVCGTTIKEITTGHKFKTYCSRKCLTTNNIISKENIQQRKATRTKNRAEILNNFLNMEYNLIEKNILNGWVDQKFKKNKTLYIDNLTKYKDEIRSILFYTKELEIEKFEQISDLKLPFRILCLKSNTSPLCECGNEKVSYQTNCVSDYCLKCSYKNRDVGTSKMANTYEELKKICNTYGYELLFEKESYKARGYYKFKHCKCNKEFERHIQGISSLKSFQQHPDMFCSYCSNGNSKWQNELLNFVGDLRVNTIQNSRPLRNNKFAEKSRNKEIDIIIPEYNLGIECDGIYTHAEILGGKDKNYHLWKTKQAKEQLGIDLIHILESEWKLKQNIVKSIISYKLNKINNKIYARKCIIKEVNVKEKNSFLENNHLQGVDKSSVKLGLYYNNELVSIMTFGTRKITGQTTFELIRFCNRINTNVIGGASKLFNHFKNNYWNGQDITTYADRRYSNGDLYYKLGFEFSHNSKPNYFYINRNNVLILYNRVKFMKHKLKDELDFFDNNLTEWENMQNNNYDRVWDCGNMVFKFKQ